MEDTQTSAEDYVMPTEQMTNINLPKDPNKWLFVMIIIGISSIFSILIGVLTKQSSDKDTTIEDWKGLYKQEKKRGDSLQALVPSTEGYVKMKYALYKIDSLTNSNNPKEKISKAKLNEEIKTALSDQ